MSKIFFNESVLSGYTDYALGGFYPEEDAKISFSTIKFQVENKISRLIDDYIGRAMAANMYSNEPFNMEKAKEYISTMLMDNLGVMPAMTDPQGFVQSVMQSDKMVKWLDETIKPRIENYLKYELSSTGNYAVQSGIPNMAYLQEGVELLPEYQEAKNAIDELTWEVFIEQLSTIEI
jgi:hypothetical protein